MSRAHPPRPEAPAAVRRRGERLAGLFAGGIVAFALPLLGIFAETALIDGIPALYLYLFAIWALIIAATALLLRLRPPPPARPRQKP